MLVPLVGLLCGGCGSIKPVTPDASPEAVALLNYIQGISGKYTLTGQHNYPNTRDTSTRLAARTWGKTPAIFGQDFGFAAPGDKDAAAARPGSLPSASGNTGKAQSSHCAGTRSRRRRMSRSHSGQSRMPQRTSSPVCKAN